LDLDHRLDLLQAPPQPLVLGPEGLVLRLQGVLALSPRAPPDEGSPLPLAAPVHQVGGVQPLPAEQGADLTRLGGPVGLFEDPQLVLGGELPPLGLLGDLRVAPGAVHGLRMNLRTRPR